MPILLMIFQIMIFQDKVALNQNDIAQRLPQAADRVCLNAVRRSGCEEASRSKWGSCDLGLGILALPEMSPHFYEPEFLIPV